MPDCCDSLRAFNALGPGSPNLLCLGTQRKPNAQADRCAPELTHLACDVAVGQITRFTEHLGPLTRSVCRWSISKRLRANARAARRYQNHFDTGKMVTRQAPVSAEIEKNQSGSPCSLNERQRAARNYQRGSRNPRPPEPLAFWRRYSS
jgi:hypothetical protein